MKRNAYIALRKNVQIYKSLNELYDDVLEFADLVPENFQSIFLVYFSTCSLALVAYLVSSFAKRFQKCFARFIVERDSLRF